MLIKKQLNKSYQLVRTYLNFKDCWEKQDKISIILLMKLNKSLLSLIDYQIIKFKIY